MLPSCGRREQHITFTLAYKMRTVPAIRSYIRVSVVWIFLVKTLVLGNVTEVEVSLEDFVERSCRAKLDFKTISEFTGFVGKFRVWESSIDDSIALSGALRRCHDDRQAIYELDKLVREYDNNRPCNYRQIGKLEYYARDFFLGSKRPLSIKFFTLFGANIGFHCKMNLLAHIKQADGEADQVDFIRSLASPLGWNVLINEYTKKSLKFGVSSHSGSDIINRVAKLIPGLSQVSQLDYLHFNHPRDKPAERVFESISWQAGIEDGELVLDGLRADSAKKVLSFTQEIVESCRRLDQLYLNSILALARLNNLGLLIEFDELDELHESSHMLHKWLAAASFCQLMVRVRIAFDETKGTIRLQVVHNEQLVESRRRLYSYMAPFDEISDKVVDRVWTTRLLDSAWRQKSGALFRPDQDSSVPMRQVKKFLLGLARDYAAYEDSLA